MVCYEKEYTTKGMDCDMLTCFLTLPTNVKISAKVPSQPYLKHKSICQGDCFFKDFTSSGLTHTEQILSLPLVTKPGVSSVPNADA